MPMVTRAKYSKYLQAIIGLMLLLMVLMNFNLEYFNMKCVRKRMTIWVEKTMERFSNEVNEELLINGFQHKREKKTQSRTSSSLSSENKRAGTYKNYEKKNNSGEINGKGDTPDSMLRRDIERLTKLLQPKKKECKPVENAIFLKTHKTGSTTVFNILQRYVLYHNKSIVLSKTNLLGWPNTFQERFILNHKRNKTYNVICNHARFHKERMLKVMTSNDTKIVTIIREPFQQFQSTVVFFRFKEVFNLIKRRNESDLESFMNLAKVERIDKVRRCTHFYKPLAVNPTTYDMGFPTIVGKPKIKDVLKKVSEDFDLVMISNYMEKSLILLKDLLCWDLRDIVYFTLNKRSSKKHQDIKDVESTRQKVFEWNDIDTALFEKFNKTLWKKISSQRKQFDEDLHDLQEANQLLKKLCLRDIDDGLFTLASGLKLKSNLRQFPFTNLCEHMAKPELLFDKELKKRSFPNEKF